MRTIDRIPLENERAYNWALNANTPEHITENEALRVMLNNFENVSLTGRRVWG